MCNLSCTHNLSHVAQRLEHLIGREKPEKVTDCAHICTLNSPCSSMVRASHCSSEDYILYTYATFTHVAQ